MRAFSKQDEAWGRWGIGERKGARTIKSNSVLTHLENSQVAKAFKQARATVEISHSTVNHKPIVFPYNFSALILLVAVFRTMSSYNGSVMKSLYFSLVISGL